MLNDIPRLDIIDPDTLVLFDDLMAQKDQSKITEYF